MIREEGLDSRLASVYALAFYPGSGENGREKSIVKREEKGILQKLKEVFWKEEEENDSKSRQKMS